MPCAEASLLPLVFGVSLPHLYSCSVPEKNGGWHMQPQQGRCLLRSSAEPLCMLRETQPGAPPDSSPLLSDACTHGIHPASCG